jgi:tape measure domain-containing protein
MSENFGAIVSIDFGNSKKNTDNLVAALHSAATAIFQIDNAIKGFTSTSKTLSSSIKDVNKEFKGILSVNGKYLRTLEKNNILNNKVIADNNSLAGTLRSVNTELNSVSKKTASYDSSNSKVSKTIRTVNAENEKLAINMAGNVVGAYIKANTAAKNYGISSSKISRTIREVSSDNAKLGLNIAGNVVGAYTKASAAAISYGTVNSRIGQTIRAVAKESRKLGITVAGDVVGSFKKAAVEAYNKNRSLEQLIKGFKRLNVNILTNVAAFNKLKKAGRIEGMFRSAKSSMGDFFGGLKVGHALLRSVAFGIIELGRRFLAWSFNVHKIASDFLGFRNAIQVATGSLEGANSQMQYAIGVARKYKVDVAETTRAYSKFVNAVTLANIPLREANKEFAVLAQVGRVLNISTTNMRGLFLAIEQMASKGFVSLEELRRQLGEHLPGAVSIAAKAWGKYIKRTISVGEFMKMVENRAVETTKFLKPFTQELDKMTKPLLEQSLKKSSAAFVDLNSSVELLGANIGTTLQPAFTALANGLNYVVKTFGRLWPEADHLKEALEEQIELFELADNNTGKYSGAIEELKKKLSNLNETMGDVSKQTESFGEKILGLSISFLSLSAATGGGGFSTSLGHMIGSMIGVEDSLGSATKKAKSLEEQLKYTGVSASATAEQIEEYASAIDSIRNLNPVTQSFEVLKLQETGVKDAITDLEKTKAKFIELKNQAEITYEEGGATALKYAAAINSINIQIDNQTRKLKGLGEQQDWIKNTYSGIGMSKEDLDEVNLMSEKFAEINERIGLFGETSTVAAVKFWAFKKGLKISDGESKGFYNALINRAAMFDDIKLADKINKKIDELKTKLRQGGNETQYAAAKALILAENIDKSKPRANALVKELLSVSKALDNEKLIQEMDDRMKEFAESSKNVGWHIQEAAANALLLANNIKLGEDRVGKKANLFIEAAKAKDEEEAIKRLTDKLESLNNKTSEYVNNAIEAETKTWLLKNGFEVGADAVGKIAEKIINVTKELDKNAMMDDFSKSINGLNANFGSLSEEQNFAAAKSLLLAHNIDLSDDAVRGMSGSLSGLNLDLANFYRGANEAAVRAEILRRGIDLNSEGAGKMAAEYLKLAKVIDDRQTFLSAAERTARSIEGAFADYLFDPFDKGVKGMVQAMSDAMRRMAAEMLAHQVMKTVTSFISGTSSGGSAGGGGDASSLFAAIASAFVSGGTPTPMATGGPVSAGTPYWVGETGTKELFVPNQNGEIITKRNVEKQEGRDSSDTYVINMNITGVTNPREFLASEAQLTGRLVEAIKARTRRK